MTQNPPPLRPPPQQNRPPRPTPLPCQKPMSPFPHEMARIVRVARSVADLDPRQGGVGGDFGEEVGVRC